MYKGSMQHAGRCEWATEQCAGAIWKWYAWSYVQKVCRDDIQVVSRNNIAGGVMSDNANQKKKKKKNKK
jgi:hypothetical protein